MPAIFSGGSNMPYEKGDYAAPMSLEDIKLPYSLEAEQSVLGSILIDPQCLYQVLDRLKAAVFLPSAAP